MSWHTIGTQRDGQQMEIRFPDKATIAESFTDDEKPVLPDGADFVEILALGVKALKLAIEESQLPEYKAIQELLGYDPGYVIDPRILADGKVPSVSLTCDGEGLPLLHLRIISKDGDWLGDATCNLWSPMGFFVSQAHGLITQLKKSGSPVTEEDFEVFIVRKTANMLKAAFSKVK